MDRKKFIILLIIIAIILILLTIFLVLFNKTNSDLPVLNYTNTDNIIQNIDTNYLQNEDNISLSNISNQTNITTENKEQTKVKDSMQKSDVKTSSNTNVTNTTKTQNSSTDKKNNTSNENTKTQEMQNQVVNQNVSENDNKDNIEEVRPTPPTETKDDTNKDLANTHFTKYNASKTKHAVNYINSKMKEDELYEKLGGKAIAVTQKPTDFWFSYSGDYKLDSISMAGVNVKVYVEDEYVYDSKGINYYLYDTKAYIYQSVI